MQNKTITSLIIISLTVMFVFNMNADISKHQKLVTHVLLSTIKSQHYNPADINDDFSKKVFKQYIERLDYGKRFFLQSDIEQLKKFEFEIDNELRQITDEFYSAANEIFYQRVNEVNEFYKEILEKPFNYDLSDSLQTDYEKLDYCNSKDELYNRWSKILQYQTALRYLEIVDSKLKVKENDVEKEDEKISYLTNEKLYEESEVKAREKIAKRTKRIFDRIIKKTEEEKYAEYLNAVTNVFDPHTSYFPPKDKEDFDIRMTGKFEGIGASLSQEDGYTKVNSIIPGSASYRQGELKQEDIILKVAQGEEEPVDVVDMPLREVVKLIRGKKGTEVCLTVRKPDMNIVVIPIIRDEVVLEETYAKAVTIKNNGKKIGYIQLLNFYRDFSDNKARNATSDIRAAIEHMDNVDGLVLDLRNNGGGALPDAIDIAGLFIETGPIVQVREKNGRKKVYRDNDPAVYHTGPLIILINQFSASASEILAAALQDYGRAVIVGSPHTYGKGTVQVMLDLDRALRFSTGDKKLGALKVTYQKFYRANGGSTQEKGVDADVVLPDVYSHLEVGEKELENALPWDTIEPANFHQLNYDNQFSKALTGSKKRLSASEQFNLIETYSREMKEKRKNSNRALNIKSIIANREKNKNESDKLDEVKTELEDAEIVIVEYYERNKADDDDKRLNDFYDDVKKDIYIQESINIITDMLK